MEPSAGISKQDIRERIWDYMESENLADFPRPVHHRIPNFKGASRAAEHFPRLQAFRAARTIKVNPDAPQKGARFFVLDGSSLACQNIRDLEVFARTREVKVDPDKPLEGVRLLALQSKKTLLVPTPRLRTGLFNKITPPPGATKDVLRKCATSQGVRSYSTPVGLESRLLVDLVVVGSVAVSEKGWRIGKGEGYADLEYAMMVSMGAASQATPVVTIVHDCQVVDIPEALLEDHDLTVDYILTPTRVIATGCARPKPAGIIWSKISCEMMRQMPVLRSLRCREEQAGKDVTLRDGHRHLPRVQAALSPGRSPCDPPRPEPGSVPSDTVYVGNLPRDARVSELKRALGALGVAPLRLTWQGAQHRAFLRYQDPAAAQHAVSCLQGFRLGANTVRVSLARQQTAGDPAGGRTGGPHPDRCSAGAAP